MKEKTTTGGFAIILAQNIKTKTTLLKKQSIYWLTIKTDVSVSLHDAIVKEK